MRPPSYVVKARRALRVRLSMILSGMSLAAIISSFIEMIQSGSVDLSRVLIGLVIGGAIFEIISIALARRSLAKARRALEEKASQQGLQLSELVTSHSLLGLYEILAAISPRSWGLVIHGRGEYTTIAERGGGDYIVVSIRSVTGGVPNLISSTIHLSRVYYVTHISGPLAPSGRMLKKVEVEGYAFIEKPRFEGSTRLEVELSGKPGKKPLKLKVPLVTRSGVLALRSPASPDEIIIGEGVSVEARTNLAIDHLEGLEHLVRTVLVESSRALKAQASQAALYKPQEGH
jgi:hypothetical protein